MTFGVFIVDQDKYAEYRAGIAPLLEAVKGRFRYDFEVARTVKSEARHEINRLFVMEFPGHASKERFFSDPRYVEIQTRLLVESVKGTTVIAVYAT